MEDDGNDIRSEVKPLLSESVSPVIPLDSNQKHASCELSSDDIENKNPLPVTESIDSNIAINKVNGDCSVECSVPFPTSPSPNNSPECILPAEVSPKGVNSSNELNDEKNIAESPTMEPESTSVEINKLDEPENLTCTSDQKADDSYSESNEITTSERIVSSDVDNTCESELSVESKTISNLNDSSSLEEKNVSECYDNLDDKPIGSRTRKSSSENFLVTTSKNSDSFKTPARYDLKSSSSKVKISESYLNDSSQKQNEGTNKVSEKTRNNRRKNDEKHQNSSEEMESNDTEKFPIQYKGFKKKVTALNEKRLNLKWNPFNPACKSNRKSSKCIPSRFPVGDEIDCSALQQSEYAQYLGLQPILKFRCSNCGSSAFQSMVALNTHQIECTKSAKGKLDKMPPSLPNLQNEHKSTNIKLTRKVFLCSACGTYYEHWNLFLHMREVHRRYICLYCLGMFSIAEKLSEHLIQKHKITHKNFNNLEDFHKHCYQAFYLLCLTCDKVFSEMDDFYGHVCNAHKKSIDSGDSSSKSEATASQECNTVPNNENCSNVTSIKSNTKKSKEASKKTTVITRSASQLKKEETKKEENGNSENKTEEISASNKEEKDREEIKSAENIDNKAGETLVSNVNETKHIEPSVLATNEVEAKPETEQEIKPQESQSNLETTPTLDKVRSVRKTRNIPKRVASKRKKLKEKEEANDTSAAKMKKITESEPVKETEENKIDENLGSVVPTVESQENLTEFKEELRNVPDTSPVQVKESASELSEDCKPEALDVPEPDKLDLDKTEEQQPTPQLEQPQTPKEDLPTSSVAIVSNTNSNSVESKNKLQANLLKFKLPGLESDAESDDSQKLSLVVDETAKSDSDDKVSAKSGINSPADNNRAVVVHPAKTADDNSGAINEIPVSDITLASEDVPVMALTLDDKIENIPIQTVLKECVRTSCMSCNYCRHAVKIAVNGKQLALHILSEHRYMPIKNETPDDVIKKLRTSLETLEIMFFNTETYDSSDSSIHVPYDQDSSFDCFQCNYVTTTHRDLFAHKRKSHTKSLLLCIMCKSNFYSYSELLCHLCPGTYNAEVQFHNVDINFRCCFCRLDTIPSAFRLMVHLRKTHHTCDICLENGVDQQKLSTHMWKHKLNHLCYRCGIAYASKPDITKHLFWKHGHESVLCKKCLQKKWPHVYHFCIPPTSFICEECNTSFSKAVALKVHKRIHGNDFPYSCSECSKKFVSKKLLQRHEERHLAIKNNAQQKQNEMHQVEEPKDEIINVSDVINENKESGAAELSDSKETEPKDKSHKKHKKDKEKKNKQVVDVYDLPPLNLSSESDSSDEDNQANENSKVDAKKEENIQKVEEKNEKINSLANSQLSFSTDVQQNEDQSKGDSENAEVVGSAEKSACQEDITTITSKEPPLSETCDADSKQDDIDKVLKEGTPQKDDSNVETNSDIVKPSAENENIENVTPNDETVNSAEVEDIWKNFYSTNPQNSNLPYPLCAIKSEIALGIIMGDHDYCQPPVIEPPVFREEIPSTSQGLSVPLITDQLEEMSEPPQEKMTEMLPVKDNIATGSSPANSPKKKPKSPKKKNTKLGAGDNENNSSSSSDSSSESSSSSCSCGPNCSCSSSSSNSSSSSSSDSESSAGEEGNKQERKRKKQERRSKTKSDHEPEPPKEQVQPEVEKVITPLEPVDPPIRESELETDETTTDEEFYDQQPQRIANQLLAEKRNQLMLLASAANANNGNASPSPITDVLPQEVVSPPKQKVRTKRKRKITTKGKTNSEKIVSNSHQFPQYPKDIEPQTMKPIPQYLNNPLPSAEPKLSPFAAAPASFTETPGSGSETEKSRSSKRRRIPNKFYGYSSGDDEEKAAPSPKWRKQDSTPQPPRIQPPPIHPPTPRIQLTVPKQIIRKPYKLQKTQPPKVQPSSSDSTDSGSEMENPRAPPSAPPVNQENTSAPATSQKNEKDVYCYCRCPYDEVSEMIACDDENCEIEWFHFECVGILVPPRGQWFCPGCRKARGLPT